MKIFSIAVCLLIVGSAFSTTHAATRQDITLGKFERWTAKMTVYTLQGRLAKREKRVTKDCYAEARPIGRKPVLQNDRSSLRLDYLGNTKNPVVFLHLNINGRSGKAVEISIDDEMHDLRQGQYKEFKSNRTIARLMTHGKTVKVTSVWPNGAEVDHIYSLDGVNKALDAIRKACQVPSM